jgi:crotonobetainyl-CoA:carnitine CoA-transferase CaiB-like acyl-CoA transferase
MGVQALADLGADVIAVEAPEGAWQRHWSGGEESGSLANELNAKQDTKQPGI